VPAGSATVKVRRSPHVIFYWRDNTLRVHNYATSDVALATPLVCSVLDYCSTWRTASQLQRAIGGSPASIKRLVTGLLRRHLLHRSDRLADSREQAMIQFRRWNPTAGFFHTATKQVRFIPRREAELVMRRQAKTWPMPRTVKRLRSAATVRLPRPVLEGEFPGVLLARRTWRRFAATDVSAARMSVALALTAGIQQWVQSDLGDLPLKTSPSGGARHPIECYVCVRRVTGVRPGLYHYAADVHALEKIRGGDLTARLRIWMPHSGYFARAAFVVVFTAVFERQLWRYPYARAYRAALAEAGHVCQTFCLTATWLGLAPFCLMGLADDEIERDLGIDGIAESVLYVAGAGMRPRGVVWAPTTRGSLKARPNPAFRRR
jgi:SagB-type dehydrogenase family enzyme